MKMNLSMSPWMKRIVSVLAIGAVFGALGYMVSPRQAGANVQKDQALQQTKQELRQALTAQRTLKQEMQEKLQQARTELTATTQRVAQAGEAAEAGKAKVTAAEKFIADLTAKLDQANTANEPMRRQMEQAQKEASQSKTQAEQSASRADALAAELAAATEQKDQLEQARQELSEDKAGLEKSLAGQTRTVTEAKELLEALSFGRGQAPPLSPVPGEMPLTRKEVVACMGHPWLSVQRGDGKTEMRWGWLGSHRAVVEDGVVTKLDGRVATRDLLGSLASVQPMTYPPLAPWRFEGQEKLPYADLVSMFGHPEGTTGTGKVFTAWWSVGAWGRSATAKVEDGLVTEFDGRAVDPQTLCQLVRHRPWAYQSVNQALKTDIALARKYYEAAVGAVSDDLARQAEQASKDGLSLVHWEVWPFDSVGTWVAATTAPTDSITVRTSVDCTWENTRRQRVTQRRYVVVCLTNDSGRLAAADFAMFAPRR